MNKLTEQENKKINNLLVDIYENIRNESYVKDTIINYNDPDGSFEYKFYYQRIKMAFEMGQKIFLRAFKEIRNEINSSKNKKTSSIDYIPMFRDIRDIGHYNYNFNVGDFNILAPDHFVNVDVAVNQPVQPAEPAQPARPLHPQEIVDEMPIPNQNFINLFDDFADIVNN